MENHVFDVKTKNKEDMNGISDGRSSYIVMQSCASNFKVYKEWTLYLTLVQV